jgi:hypothetical protein
MGQVAVSAARLLRGLDLCDAGELLRVQVVTESDDAERHAIYRVQRCHHLSDSHRMRRQDSHFKEGKPEQLGG